MAYERQCPKCSILIIYPQNKSLVRASNSNSLCISCSAKGKRGPRDASLGFVRHCPGCNRELAYKSKATVKRAEREGTLCKACTNSRDKLIDILGMRFGKLMVIGSTNRDGVSYWVCQCECGQIKEISGCSNLRNGNIVSCGCANAPIKVPPSRYIFRMYVSNAKRAGRKMLLTEDEVAHLTSLPCHYCGAPPSQLMPNMPTKNVTSAHLEFRWNGIDRINSDKGYETSNCVPCCRTCNRMKMEHPYEEWVRHMERILAHIGSRETSTSVALLFQPAAPEPEYSFFNLNPMAVQSGDERRVETLTDHFLEKLASSPSLSEVS